MVARGGARRIESAAELAEVEKLPLRPYVPTVKRNFVRIEPTVLSGRRFRIGAEPLDPGDGAS